MDWTVMKQKSTVGPDGWRKGDEPQSAEDESRFTV